MVVAWICYVNILFDTPCNWLTTPVVKDEQAIFRQQKQWARQLCSLPFDLHCKAIAALFFIPFRCLIWGHYQLHKGVVAEQTMSRLQRKVASLRPRSNDIGISSNNMTTRDKEEGSHVVLPFDSHCKAIAALFFLPLHCLIWGYY